MGLTRSSGLPMRCAERCDNLTGNLFHNLPRSLPEELVDVLLENHHVAWTTADEPTVWLAVFYKD